MEKHERLIQFFRYLQEYVKDTEKFLAHKPSPEVKAQLVVLQGVLRRFRELFTTTEDLQLQFEKKE